MYSNHHIKSPLSVDLPMAIESAMFLLQAVYPSKSIKVIVFLLQLIIEFCTAPLALHIFLMVYDYFNLIIFLNICIHHLSLMYIFIVSTTC